MFRCPIFVFVLLALSGLGLAQKLNGECPKISLHTKTVTPKKGDVVFYSVVVDGKWESENVRHYFWNVEPSFDFTGQNTPTIAIPFNGDMAGSSLTVSVVVRGLPANCTNHVSESMIWEPPPLSVKMVEIRSYDLQLLSKLINDEVAPEANSSPNNQIYVFLGHKTGMDETAIKLREEAVVTQLTVKSKIPRDRVSIQNIKDVGDAIEIWRVPPGADNPTCAACDVPDKENKASSCPVITLYGPPGVTNPGELFVFTLAVKGELPKRVSYNWNVSQGRIVSGQGTSSIKVEAQWKTEISLTATLNVIGLPQGCPAEFRETAAVASSSN